ncbi:Mlc titration factor A [Cesiribacter andamanensis AMV16]|uniref:Mlc titration factor A n=1 Tax=Cesiribacter andamanensis AMV16 TaxID=1279009 RepID=M7P0X9_9BACT|nr:Mlc titration factor A [Cesiribacter andamanensis AMV16]
MGILLLLAVGGISFMAWVLSRQDAPAVLPLKPAYRRLLQQHSLYYQQLSPYNQKRFEKRVQQFINLKRFVPRNMPQVTAEMKVLIAASAVQLTFGLPNVYLRHFKTILVYPDNYYSTISKRYHKGEVNPWYGIIVLSWKAFVEGLADPGDSLNLGLHEMAHALRLENVVRNDEHSFLKPHILKQWTDESQLERQKIGEGQSHFFRQYAALDDEEFFAIAVENFFERPQQFWQELPHLYRTLSLLLNQDPLLVVKE